MKFSTSKPLQPQLFNVGNNKGFLGITISMLILLGQLLKKKKIFSEIFNTIKTFESADRRYFQD